MKIHLPANAIILPIIKNSVTYYFFLDTGFPISFANNLDEINHINHKNLGIEPSFDLTLQTAPIDIQPLSEHLMINLSGFLGMDFLCQFDNVAINFAEREINFNITGFQADAEIPLISNSPLIIELAIESSDQFKTCLVDTGSYQSLFFNAPKGVYPKSFGWQFPSAFGNMMVDFYAGIEAKAHNINFGKHIFGQPSNLPAMGFDYILGLNILSQYECCFNLKQNSIQLRNNPREFRHGADLSAAIYCAGLQIIRHKDKLYVANILTGFAQTDIKIGDLLELPEIDFNNPELINEVYKRMSPTITGKQLEVCIDKEITRLVMGGMFKSCKITGVSTLNASSITSRKNK